MRLFFSVLVSFIVLSASAQKPITITKDSAFKKLKSMLENRSFVVNSAVYKLYDLNLKDCQLEYKIYFQDQDDAKGKISTHRSYTVDLSKLQPSFTKTFVNKTNWLVLKTSSGFIRESILPEPKKNAIPKPYTVQNINEAFIPLDVNDGKYAEALNKLIGFCRH